MSTMSSEPGTDNAPVRLQEAAGSIADSAGQAAEAQASRAMTRAGDSLGDVAQVLHDTGNRMRDERPEIADLVETGAQRVDQLSAYVRETDVRGVIDDAEAFARRQPAVVIAGGLAIGLLVGRVLRSGAEPSRGQWSGGTSDTQHFGGGDQRWSRSSVTGMTDALPTDPAGSTGMTGTATSRTSEPTTTSTGRTSVRSRGSSTGSTGSTSSRSRSRTTSSSGS
jgi:ElaB/YqjD/DUF883 family membrane-anchored ribosome-binding protein